jgi:hypothetical protein
MREQEHTFRNSSGLAASLAAVCTLAMSCGNVSGHGVPGAYGENALGQGGAGQVEGRLSTGDTALPCDVNDATRVCRTCHAQRPLPGVPMALVTYEDFHAQSVTTPSMPVYAMAHSRIDDVANPMPPASAGALGPNDKGVIESWLSNGAPQGTDPSCKPIIVPMGSGGSGGGVGGGGNGTGAGTGAGGGGVVVDVPDAAPPVDQGTCYKILAHGQGTAGDTTPYAVQGEQYVAFDFNAPWPTDAQGISFKSVFDDHPEIVHHWLLYLGSSAIFPFPMPDGAIEPNENGSHPGATLIAGWAPGGDNGVNLPSDVGMDINGTSHRVVLEIHFYPGAGSFSSRSGVEVCTTKTPRPKVATVSWLGTESISLPPAATNSVSGTCAPSSTQDIHILRTWPHMHKIGVHMQTVVNHQAGAAETLVDKDFNFSSQISYDKEIVIKPGDTLKTTCTYNNTTNGTVVYGTKTTNEMCFNFVTAWPAGLLQHGTAMNGSQNPCMN